MITPEQERLCVDLAAKGSLFGPPRVYFKRITEGDEFALARGAVATIPFYAHPGEDAGLDLFAAENGQIPVGGRQLVRCGVLIQLPPMHEAQVRARSGLTLNKGVAPLNAPGTIDPGYRGEVGVILMNHGDKPWPYRVGEKIAQLVIAQLAPVQVFETSVPLAPSNRGEAGFGSTGTKA